MCVYIWVIRKGCLLLLRLCKSSLVAITGFWRKCMRPHKAPVRPFSIHHGCGEPACPVTCAIQAGRLLQGRPAELCPVPNSAQMAASLLYHRTGMWSASGHHTAGGRWSSHVGCRARKGPQGLSRTVGFHCTGASLLCWLPRPRLLCPRLCSQWQHAWLWPPAVTARPWYPASFSCNLGISSHFSSNWPEQVCSTGLVLTKIIVQNFKNNTWLSGKH